MADRCISFLYIRTIYIVARRQDIEIAADDQFVRTSELRTIDIMLLPVICWRRGSYSSLEQ